MSSTRASTTAVPSRSPRLRGTTAERLIGGFTRTPFRTHHMYDVIPGMHLAHSRVGGQSVPVVRRPSGWHDLRPLTSAITPDVLSPDFLRGIGGADLPSVDDPQEFGPPLAG